MIGVLGKALANTGIKLHLIVVSSNHYHAALTDSSASAIATMMRFFQGNLSKE